MTAKVVSTVALAKVVSNCFELVAPPPPLSPPIFVLFLLLFLGTSLLEEVDPNGGIEGRSKLFKVDEGEEELR